jgi:hypothetical protein
MHRTLARGKHVGPSDLTPSLPLWVLTTLARPDGQGYYISALRAAPAHFRIGSWFP